MRAKYFLSMTITFLFTACARPNQNNNDFGGRNVPEEAVIYHAPQKREAKPAEPTPRAQASPAPVSSPMKAAKAPPPEAKPTAPLATNAPSPAVATPATTPDAEMPKPTYFQLSAEPPSSTENENLPALAAATIPAPALVAEPAPARNAPEKAPRNGAAGLEKQLLEMINQSRAEQGIAPLVFNRARSKGNAKCMGSVGHAEAMAAQDRLSHDNFPANICFQTNASAENVGFATGDENPALKQVHKAMTESPGHYQNLMNPQFNNVGLGFFYYKGALWVTESFLRL